MNLNLLVKDQAIEFHYGPIAKMIQGLSKYHLTFGTIAV